MEAGCKLMVMSVNNETNVERVVIITLVSHDLLYQWSCPFSRLAIDVNILLCRRRDSRVGIDGKDGLRSKGHANQSPNDAPGDLTEDRRNSMLRDESGFGALYGAANT